MEMLNQKGIRNNCKTGKSQWIVKPDEENQGMKWEKKWKFAFTIWVHLKN
jgi:hypothetical protein